MIAAAGAGRRSPVTAFRLADVTAPEVVLDTGLTLGRASSDRIVDPGVADLAHLTERLAGKFARVDHTDISRFLVGREPRFELVHDPWNPYPTWQFALWTTLSRTELERIFPALYGMTLPGLEDIFGTVFVRSPWPGLAIRFGLCYRIDNGRRTGRPANGWSPAAAESAESLPRESKTRAGAATSTGRSSGAALDRVSEPTACGTPRAFGT